MTDETISRPDSSKLSERSFKKITGKIQPKWSEWEKQGIVPFWLPPYCSEMNQIENEWEPLKGFELAGQMFEDELDLAYAVMARIEGRAQSGGYTVERFRF